MIKPISKRMKIVRWLNFIGLNLCLLFMLPVFLVYKLDLKTHFFIVASNFTYLGFYLFIFTALWVFLYFAYLEIEYCNKNKVPIFKHVFGNPLVLLGIITVFIYLIFKIY